MKIDKDKISKYKLDFIKLAELPAPDSLTEKMYQHYLKTRDEESNKFDIYQALTSILGNNYKRTRLTYNEKSGAYLVSHSPEFLYHRYIEGYLISSPDSGQDPKVWSIKNLHTASKHAARQWGYFEDVGEYILPDGSVDPTPPSSWHEYGTFNLVMIENKLIIVPIDVEHRNWGLVGFPLGIVPLPEKFEKLYFYNDDLPEVYDEVLDKHVKRICVNGMFLSDIVEKCKNLGAYNVTEETVRERFWSNKFNFRFLPFYSRAKTEKFFSDINDSSIKTPVQLFHGKPNESLYWFKDYSSIKVTKFKPSGKSLHPLFENMTETSLVSLESLMISVLVGQFNKEGRTIVDRGDKYLIDKFNQYDENEKIVIMEDLDFLHSITSKYIDVGQNIFGLQITRPLAQILLTINDKFKSLGYIIVDKALFINDFQRWFGDNQETANGEVSIFAGHWRKGPAAQAEAAYEIIQEEFLEDFDKNRLRKIGVIKKPKIVSRTFSKKVINDDYKKQNGKDVDNETYVYPVGGHIIADMELIRMTSDERDEAFKQEDLGDKFDFDKNCRAMSSRHNLRMGVLRLSEYKSIINESDAVVKKAVLKKYKELQEKEILV
tara:strand:+ start:471 stop:2279 length:1809 start_codon:yes stop_codon:yes gene_type:complete